MDEARQKAAQDRVMTVVESSFARNARQTAPTSLPAPVNNPKPPRKQWRKSTQPKRAANKPPTKAPETTTTQPRGNLKANPSASFPNNAKSYKGGRTGGKGQWPRN
jgi:hypothetical protein